MQRLLPFAFPVAALLIVAFLAFRWYGQQTAPQADIAEFGEGVQIEELSEAERDRVVRGTGDFNTIDLEPITEETADDAMMMEEETEAMDDSESMTMTETSYMGQVRYEVVDNKVSFNVSLAAPELDSGMYQVWLKAVDSEAIRKAFVLEYSKSGYMGSAAISADTLPFEVVVTRELSDDASPEEMLLKAVIESDESAMNDDAEDGTMMENEVVE